MNHFLHRPRTLLETGQPSEWVGAMPLFGVKKLCGSSLRTLGWCRALFHEASTASQCPAARSPPSGWTSLSNCVESKNEKSLQMSFSGRCVHIYFFEARACSRSSPHLYLLCFMVKRRSHRKRAIKLTFSALVASFSNRFEPRCQVVRLPRG